MLGIESRCYVCGFAGIIRCADAKTYGVEIVGMYKVNDNAEGRQITRLLNVELHNKVLHAMHEVGEPNEYGYVELKLNEGKQTTCFSITKEFCEEYVDDVFQIGDSVGVLSGTLTGIVQAYIFYENKLVVKSDKIGAYKDKACRYTYKGAKLGIIDKTPLEVNTTYSVDSKEKYNFNAYCIPHKSDGTLALVSEDGLLLCGIPKGTTLQKVMGLINADRMEKLMTVDYAGNSSYSIVQIVFGGIK